MKRFYISGTHGAIHDTNIQLWKTLWRIGTFVKHEYNGAYSVVTIAYHGTQYELWSNDDLGIMSMIVEL